MKSRRRRFIFSYGFTLYFRLPCHIRHSYDYFGYAELRAAYFGAATAAFALATPGQMLRCHCHCHMPPIIFIS